MIRLIVTALHTMICGDWLDAYSPVAWRGQALTSVGRQGCIRAVNKGIAEIVVRAGNCHTGGGRQHPDTITRASLYRGCRSLLPLDTLSGVSVPLKRGATIHPLPYLILGRVSALPYAFGVLIFVSSPGHG